MSRYNSETYRKDLQKTIESANDILKALEGKKVLLTGATGLIGAAIADLLIWYNKDRNVPVELYAAGRNEKQIEEKFEPYEKAAWFHIVPYEATGKIKFECPVNYIIHGAGIAYPKMFTQSPVETMRVASVSYTHLREECMHAFDLGNFYRVPADNRDLNYEQYYEKGQVEKAKLEEFTSDNTTILNVEQVKEKLLSLEYVRNELENM